MNWNWNFRIQQQFYNTSYSRNGFNWYYAMASIGLDTMYIFNSISTLNQKWEVLLLWYLVFSTLLPVCTVQAEYCNQSY